MLQRIANIHHNHDAPYERDNNQISIPFYIRMEQNHQPSNKIRFLVNARMDANGYINIYIYCKRFDPPENQFSSSDAVVIIKFRSPAIGRWLLNKLPHANPKYHTFYTWESSRI